MILEIITFQRETRAIVTRRIFPFPRRAPPTNHTRMRTLGKIRPCETRGNKRVHRTKQVLSESQDHVEILKQIVCISTRMIEYLVQGLCMDGNFAHIETLPMHMYKYLCIVILKKKEEAIN